MLLVSIVASLLERPPDNDNPIASAMQTAVGYLVPVRDDLEPDDWRLQLIFFAFQGPMQGA